MEWISVEERLPNVGTKVLMYTDSGISEGCYQEKIEDGIDSMGCDAGWHGDNGFVYPGRHFGNPKYYCEAFSQPTHWMPLPEPPRE